MGYFRDNYSAVRFPIAEGHDVGLRRGQLGAIHGLASHFTVKKHPAIVTMPTGSGKTAVLMATAFLQRCRRALVLTPSKLVRNQVAREFASLEVLKRIGVVPSDLAVPVVIEAEHRQRSESDWHDLLPADVVVATPNAVSPGHADVSAPPDYLFDLLLVDEAHHSPARTWRTLIDAFSTARCALFTATPYREDGREIRGDFAYTYSLREAMDDGIFSRVTYIPVSQGLGESSDVAIARQAERTLRDDHAHGLEHYLMVRTDTKARAEELVRVYKDATGLRLMVVHSGHSFTRVIEALKKLQGGELDGIICVDMFGEGFDFPQLKIAAVHAPHKSLGVTLQFVGRFARGGQPNLGDAKFIAVPSEIFGERERLYAEHAVWHEIIPELSQTRIDRELRVKKLLSEFHPPLEQAPEAESVSLYALRPASHVKIYQVESGVSVDITSNISFDDSLEIIYRQPDADLGVSVMLTKQIEFPRWIDLPEFASLAYDLFVVYFDSESNLLFINSSRRSTTLYENIATSLTGGAHRILPLSRVNHVLADLANPDFFNIGMRNNLPSSSQESYRIVTGSRAQNAISKTDGKLYHRGHVFCRGEEAGKPTTLGYSSSSKVWSHASVQLPELLEWCKALARKIRDQKEVKTGSGLDYLTVGREVDQIPGTVIAVDWPDSVYEDLLQVELSGGNSGRLLADTSLELSPNSSGNDPVCLSFEVDQQHYGLSFSLRSTRFVSAADNFADDACIAGSRDRERLIDFLNNDPPILFLSDGSVLRGRYHVPVSQDFDPLENSIFKVIDWGGAGVDICSEDGSPGNGKRSIHSYLQAELSGSHDLVFYDHGSGEMADFIAFDALPAERRVTFYHCKRSFGAEAGSRLKDLYDVCGQAIKSLRWAGPARMILAHVKRRRKRTTGILSGGDINRLEELLLDGENRLTYRVVLVQPGIASRGLGPQERTVLAATNDYVRRETGEGIRAWCSD